MRKNLIGAAAILSFVSCVTYNQETVKLKVDREIPLYYQAYDEGWYSDPSINPIFENEWEAKDYVNRNMMNEIQSGHNYVVRVVNHRYEVRQVNDEDDDILYTSNEFNDAYDYVVEYSSAHSDLIIYDLKTGEGHEETP